MPRKRILSAEKFREKVLKWATRPVIPRDQRPPPKTNADALIESLGDAALGYVEEIADEKGGKRTVQRPPSPTARQFLCEQLGGKPSSVAPQQAAPHIKAADRVSEMARNRLNALTQKYVGDLTDEAESESANSPQSVASGPESPASASSKLELETSEDDPAKFDPCYEPSPVGRKGSTPASKPSSGFGLPPPASRPVPPVPLLPAPRLRPAASGAPPKSQ